MIRTENPRVGKDKLETDKKEQPLTACDKEPPKQINTFTQEQLYEIRRVFKFEIVTKSVTMDAVRSKIQTNYALEHCDPRRVYDRIRSEWRASTPSSVSQEPPSLPTDRESLDDKLERMSSGETSTNTIPPTQVSAYVHAIFRSSQIELLKKLFPTMIKGKAPISKKVIENTLRENKEAAAQLSNIKTAQIVNRLKFEKRNLQN